MKYALVITTINIPIVLAEYIANAKNYHIKDLVIIVVGDRKSPEATADYLKKLPSQYPIEYLNIERQQDYLSKTPAFRDFLPFDSVQRRNVGYLFATWEYNPDIIITIDDDNFPIESVDFFGGHGVVGTSVSAELATADNGWFNSCSLLESTPTRNYYHRGYPVSKRDLSSKVSTLPPQQRKILVNVGLWLGDPDVDTISRLDGQSTITRINSERSYLIAKGCMCTFNSQNTAFSSELLPCIYLPAIASSFNTPILKGNNNFRYDDIWMSYFTKICLDQLNGGLLVGHPIVEQKRNVHDLFLDLEKESLPMRLTDILADELAELKPKGSGFLDCYANLTDQFQYLCNSNPSLGDEERAVLAQITHGMHLWIDTVGSH